MGHNFLVPVVDTDSITICKLDNSPFSQEEVDKLHLEINSLNGELINWEKEFVNLNTLIVIAAKNYILWDGKKLKIKGASLKATNKEPYLKDFINQVIDILLKPDFIQDEIIDLYNKTAKETLNLTDMSRHSKKKTITEKVLKGDGTSELRTRLALKGVNYQQGDKFKFFYLPNGNMCLDTNFNGEYDQRKLLEKLYKTMEIFDAVVPISLFKNYKLQINYYPLLGIEKPLKAKKNKIILVKNEEV